MISKIAGTILSKDTKTKVWWIKLGIALVLSNIFFFILFKNENPKVTPEIKTPEGMVEVQLQAILLTPFQKGKKVWLINRVYKKQVEAMLQNEVEGKFEILVKEEQAPVLFQYEIWEILPFIKSLNFQKSYAHGADHEIRY